MPLRSRSAINDRRRRHADFRTHLAASSGVAQGLACRKQRYPPQHRARIGVEGIDRIVFRGHENHVVRRTLNAQLRYIQRLGIDLAVHLQVAQQAEARCSHVRRRQSRFREILTAAAQIVLIGNHVRSRRHGSIGHGQLRTAAGGAAARVADDHGETTAAVCGRRGARRVAGRGGAGDRCGVFLPLIAQGCSARCGHREGGGLSYRHVLIRRLNADRRDGRRGRRRRRRHRGRAGTAAAAAGNQKQACSHFERNGLSGVHSAVSVE